MERFLIRVKRKLRIPTSSVMSSICANPVIKSKPRKYDPLKLKTLDL